MDKTLFDKVWNAHSVEKVEGALHVLYIDQHIIHEVTSPQAFQELDLKAIPVRCPEKILATADHNVPTINQELPIKEPLSRKQIQQLEHNCEKHGIPYFGLGHPYQGIVHVIAPELGITQPGMTIVCGDSHTSTHGAFGALAFGIGTSQVAQVLATQCLLIDKPKKMNITINGKLSQGVQPKDVILYIISKLGTNAGTGYFIEYSGEVFHNMSMEGRMTVCNMSIEMGARGGMIAPDKTTFNYIKGKKYAPKNKQFEEKIAKWASLSTDPQASFDKTICLEAAEIAPMISYGTNPGMSIKINHRIPEEKSTEMKRALSYMGFKPGEQLLGKKIDYVFIGSCTNARIEDFAIVGNYIRGKQKAANVQALLVPGSQQVSQQIRETGLEEIFRGAGFSIRQPGCSACLGMNEDKIPSGAYCLSTSNRNFEGRQGAGARTLLASPLTAAAAAIAGKIVMP